MPSGGRVWGGEAKRGRCEAGAEAGCRAGGQQGGGVRGREGASVARLEAGGSSSGVRLCVRAWAAPGWSRCIKKKELE